MDKANYIFNKYASGDAWGTAGHIAGHVGVHAAEPWYVRGFGHFIGGAAATILPHAIPTMLGDKDVQFDPEQRQRQNDAQRENIRNDPKAQKMLNEFGPKTIKATQGAGATNVNNTVQDKWGTEFDNLSNEEKNKLGWNNSSALTPEAQGISYNTTRANFIKSKQSGK